MTTPQPGWYQDPVNPDLQKWWDGRNWTDHTQPLAVAAQGGTQGYGQGAAYAGGYPGYRVPARSNPAALVGFILGLVSVPMFWIPFLGTGIALAAGACAAVGLSNQKPDMGSNYKVFGVIGLILGIIFTLLSLLILAAIFMFS